MIKIEVLGKKFEVDHKFIGEIQGFPNAPEDKLFHNHFKISIKHKNKKISFDFYGSNHDFELFKRKLDSKDLMDTFRVFFEDAIAGLMNFEEFAGDFGYDPDSRRAEKVWKAVKQQTAKAYTLGLSDDDLYDLSNATREGEENYTELSES